MEVATLMIKKIILPLASIFSLIIIIALVSQSKVTPIMRSRQPEKLLAEIKTYFMNVSGSYILYEPQNYTKSGVSYKVYQAGITTTKHDQSHSYDVFVDTQSGEVIDIVEKA